MKEAALLKGLKNRDWAVLAKAITLIESDQSDDKSKAQELLQKLPAPTKPAYRIGITGVPGSGKSTLIDRLGCYLNDQGYRVAVLAIDPSSHKSGGSILGDKTRMENLARRDACFIRPSPSGKTMGGVHRKTRESIILCEATGFDIILVETVGTGQNEAAVHQMVDFFLLLTLTGGGDELQTIKKGVIELADTILIHKADGANEETALQLKSELNQTLHFLQPTDRDWICQAITASSLNNVGIEGLWKVIVKHREVIEQSKQFDRKRRWQNQVWFKTLVETAVIDSFYQNKRINETLQKLNDAVADGSKTAVSAAEELLLLWKEQK